MRRSCVPGVDDSAGRWAAIPIRLDEDDLIQRRHSAGIEQRAIRVSS